MLNELRNDRPGDANFFLCPTTVLAGDAVLIGARPAIALDSYSAASGGTVFRFAGTYNLTVVAATVLSPLTGTAIKQGQKIYADTNGTLDSATNVYYGFTLDAATGGTLFGALDQSTALVTGTTNANTAVALKETM